MEEQTARRTLWFDAPGALQREILEPGNHSVDLREWLRQRRSEVDSADVEFVMAHRQEQIAPAFGRKPMADHTHLINEWKRRSGRETGKDIWCDSA